MNHEQARRALLGLALNPSDADRRAAIEAVMEARDTEGWERTWTLPLTPGPSGARWAYLRLPHPISQHDWTLLHEVLAAMRPGLVRDVVDELPDAPPEAPPAPGTAPADTESPEAPHA